MMNCDFAMSLNLLQIFVLVGGGGGGGGSGNIPCGFQGGQCIFILILTSFMARSHLVACVFDWGKTVSKSVNGKNLKQITKLTVDLCF